VQEEMTLQSIHAKRRRFYFLSAIVTSTLSVLIMIAGIFLFTFWLSIVFACIICLVSLPTWFIMNRMYTGSITVNRNQYIDRIFPIEGKLSKQQLELIISDLDYMFTGLDTKDEQSTLAILYKRLKTNDLNIKDIEKLNLIYSKAFIDLTKIKRR
jgi:ABC-type multidrug transport system fused ATPase/permease subunit